MTAAVAQLDQVLAEVVAAHHGVRPVEQGEGDSFVVAFTGASDAVACALELQRAPLAPIRLRIGVHTGEVQLRDEGNYIGPTINRTARLRDLAHGGQTVLSGATEPLVVDWLPADVWLIDLGTHQLRDLPRPERVVQLCHPDLHNEFSPLRTSTSVAARNLPPQFTSFVGRGGQITELRRLLADNRLVTLTGAGGAGKTRLAVEIAARTATDFRDGVWCVDLASITHPAVVPVAVARTLGLSDQPGCSTMDTVLQFLRDRQILVVLDNCEHLLDACAELVVGLLGGAARLTLLATSREPLNVAGEATWQVPSLSFADEAIELFADRARLVRPDFAVTGDNAAAVTEICRRLDGMPLAIELAAARVRVLSLAEIVDSLHDHFRLLTGGSRTAVRRQQTLRASVDWSHALLTATERVLFRRLAVFLGGFDLQAAESVAGADGVQRYQVLDQLTLLVDKSLVIAENSEGRTRYRLLETVRQYALEKLGESGEADAVRSRHRDHYAAMAAALDAPGGTDYEQLIEQAAGDVAAAQESGEAARQHLSVARGLAAVQSAFYAQVALAAGDLTEARLRADDAVTTTTGWYLMVALTTRARVAIDQGEADQAERDAHDALAYCAEFKAHLGIPDILEILAAVGVEAGNHREAARLYGAAQSARERMGAARFKVWDAGHQDSVTALRETLGDTEFDAAWAEGAALSNEEAIAYVQCGRGERKRPASGWGSLTPTERDVVRLVGEGLSNKDIGTRLFISPRTVESHLSHVYAKLGSASRVQLAQEAARHA